MCAARHDMACNDEQLNVTPKYLSDTVRRATGSSVTAFIDCYAVSILKEFKK